MHTLIYLLFFLIISFSSNAVDTKAEQAIVLDFDTNEVLFEKNSKEKMLNVQLKSSNNGQIS